MSLWAVLPVKPLNQGKTRLSGVLDTHDRYMLASTLFGHTLQTLAKVKSIAQILVVSKDPTALAVAREFGAKTVQEESPSNLNLALGLATRLVVAGGAQQLLILPCDLPLLSVPDVENFLSNAVPSPFMIIAPDRRRDGTNAILLSPPNSLDYQFGPESFRLHVDQARQKNLRVVIYQSAAFELDLDLPEDLETLKQIELKKNMKEGETHV